MTSKQGMGMQSFKPFCQFSKKSKRVVEVRRSEQERRYLHLVHCAQQGQCLKRQELIVERKISWKELWSWEAVRTSFPDKCHV